MQRTGNIFINITLSDIHAAADKALDGHINESKTLEMIGKKGEAWVTGHTKNPSKREMTVFVAHRSYWEQRLLDRLQDGTWTEAVRYRPMEIVNNNGKEREIDCPNLTARIYQHLVLNLLVPLYDKKDPLVGLNCKKGCGISGSMKERTKRREAVTDEDKKKQWKAERRRRKRSVARRMKHIIYDETAMRYGVVTDQRKCYEHVTERIVRKGLKRITTDKRMIDFAVAVIFVDGHLPIGTPSSPFAHHVAMLGFDMWLAEITPWCVRYADDVFAAFETKEEAQQMLWRIKNYWWYELGIRAKRWTARVVDLDEPLDFCGIVLHRGDAGHGKGYATIRESIAESAKKCKTDESWGAFFGLMSGLDTWSLSRKIEEMGDLRRITERYKIKRGDMDAVKMDIRDVTGKLIVVVDYEIRRDSNNSPNWVKCLFGIYPQDYTPIPLDEAQGMTDDEIDAYEAEQRKKMNLLPTYEFHGDYQGIYRYLLYLEEMMGGKENVLPIENAEIENQCGYIFKNSTDMVEYLDAADNFRKIRTSNI